MFIYLPAHGRIPGKLLSTSAITEIKIAPTDGGYHVQIFYWAPGSKLNSHIIFADKDQTKCQNYIENLSKILPSITLEGPVSLVDTLL